MMGRFRTGSGSQPEATDCGDLDYFDLNFQRVPRSRGEFAHFSITLSEESP